MVPGVEAYTSMISGYSVTGDVKGAFRVLDMMNSRGITPNSYTMTSLMSAALNGKKFSLALSLLHSEQKYFAKLNKEQRSALHGAYVIKMCKISIFVGNMVRNGELDSSIGYVKQHQYVQEALATLLRMEMKGLQPDAATLNAFMQALCACEYGDSRMRASLELLQTMIRMGITPDDYTYGMIFDELGKKGMFEQAIQLYNSLLANGVALPTTALNNLLKVFVSSEQPIYGVGFFFELIRSDEEAGLMEQFIPDKISFTMMFIALAKLVRSATDADTLRRKSKQAVGVQLPRRTFVFPANTTTFSPLFSVYRGLGIVQIEATPDQDQDHDHDRDKAEQVAGAVDSNGDGDAAAVSRLEEQEAGEEFLETFTSLRYDGAEGRLYETDLLPVNATGSLTATAPASVPAPAPLSSAPSDEAKLGFKSVLQSLSVTSRGQMTKKPEELLRELYQFMRYRYRIEPDETLCKVLDSLFSVQPSPSLIYSLGRKSFTGEHHFRVIN